MKNKGLLERFCTALNVLGHTSKWEPSSPLVASYFEEMSDPRRIGHNMSLVDRYLQVLDCCNPELSSKHSVEVALFLLDSGPGVGYAARRQDAYARACDFVPGMRGMFVQKLIGVTLHQFPWVELEGDMAVVADISLEYLGGQWFDFEHHLDQVKREYVEMGRLDLVGVDKEFHRQLYRLRRGDGNNRIYRCDVFEDTFGFLADDNLLMMFGEEEEFA